MICTKLFSVIYYTKANEAFPHSCVRSSGRRGCDENGATQKNETGENVASAIFKIQFRARAKYHFNLCDSFEK